jgi:protein-S-isoprenylcysteine O-methyltransferase Ste14
MTRFPKYYADRVARLRVPSGFLLLALFVWLSNPSAGAILSGLPVSILGLGMRAWAAGHLAKNERLATAGPYAVTRNPLYFGTALVAAGLLIAARSWWLAVGFSAIFALVYFPVIELESQHLSKLFPAYAEYCQRVPLLVPRLIPAGPLSGWEARLYRKNQEWKGLLAFIVALTFLVVKCTVGSTTL